MNDFRVFSVIVSIESFLWNEQHIQVLQLLIEKVMHCIHLFLFHSKYMHSKL